ncbi:glycosyltransferase family 4 protein [Bradyrhizobium sp. LHD-71]|uniref:glycosyltransferase family 4 protein n=1 Tax=Bradyrhizobium sp. LHD-71 TaxID=3072141 RepID=UPI00280D828B|nr:glycosyltransferase family 4 protein [Bradyrhizobium sp. LHD-71]MDQ8730274.1 glycosyltransferase family 4 protein [Bradyrhizobium sp. LHD-71]
MKRAAFAVPGSLDTPTGGYAYDKRIITELRALGWQVDVVDLGNSFPNPDRAARELARAKLLALNEGEPLVVDGLAFGVMADEAAQLCARNPLVALVHHPLALETGIPTGKVRALRDSEREALSCARFVIVTSQPTATIVTRDYAVPAERVAVICPGVDRGPLTKRSTVGAGGAVRLLAVGSIVPRKGYDILIEALAGLDAMPWQLTIVGDTTRDAAASARLEADTARLQLQDRVVIAGAVTGPPLNALYAGADVFVLASLFEGYGMVFAEAIAYGLPVVATAVGVAKDIVPADAGVLVTPGDVPALQEALRRVIADADLRLRMAESARTASRGLPEWRQSALQFAQVLEAVT